MSRPLLTLAPVPYHWPRARLLDFYQQIAQAPLDVIYLGETVCSRRRELKPADWLALAQDLAAPGRQIVLSSRVLVESEPEVKELARLADNGRFPVEANDMGAVRLLQHRGPFVAGSSLNLFNGRSLQLLADLGACRWVVPPELSAQDIAQIQAQRPPGLQTELMVHGRLALAHSARCFTARHFGLQKDACEFRCIEFEDGLRLRTRDGEGFLVLNGTQTQSERVHNLVDDLPRLLALGIDALRIAPQAQGTLQIVQLFKAVLEGAQPAAAALQSMHAWMPAAPCNGFLHDRPGREQVVQ